MIFILIVVLLALIGVPLFAIFGGATIGLFLEMPEGSWASVAIDVFSAKFAENPTLMTIPLFTFAGYLLAEAKTPQRLVELSRAWLGWMPGGLALVCLMASAFFTTFTGGSGITIVAVGGLLLPALIQEGYPHKFSMGLVTTAGSLGLLFPPSVPLILYGIVASLVIDKIMVAGILPGILVVIVLAVYGGIVGVRSGVKRHPFTFQEAWRTFWIAKWEIAIPIVLIGGMALGILRIHEASAFTAVYVLFIEVFVYRDIKITKDLPKIVIESMTLVGVILVIMAAAIGFNAWMIQAEVPTKLLNWMDEMVSSRFVFLLMMNLILLVVGMLMDIFTAIVVVVPLLLPMADHYQVDPYHLAIIFLLNLEIGYLTPPVGINLFISSVRFGESITYLYRLVIPFIGVMLLALMIVTYVPILTTILPDQIKVANEVQTMGGGYLKEGELDDVVLPPEEDMGMSPSDMDLGEDGGLDGGVDGGGPGLDGGSAKAAPDEAAAKPAEAPKPAKAKGKKAAAKP